LNGKSLDARRSAEAAMKRYRDFRLQDRVEREQVARKSVQEVVAGARASGYVQGLKKPKQNGLGKGQLKIRRRAGGPQVIVKIGSSGWIRTSNPPVNRRKKRR
jgi:hypothetical protein